MVSSLFVTGTDTGVGKTLAACALLHQLRGRGLRALGMKPVAAGVEPSPEGPVNPDVAALRQASSWPGPLDQVNPYLFEPPIAPHLAATAVGVRIELPRIVQAFRALARAVDEGRLEHAVRIAVGSPEAPADVVELADLVV